MTYCQPCLERGRPNVTAERVIDGTPMCHACFGGPRRRDELKRVLAATEKLSAEIKDIRKEMDRLRLRLLPDKTVHTGPTLTQIKSTVAAHFGWAELPLGARTWPCSDARAVAIHVSREFGYSWTDIAHAMSYHHTSAITAKRKVEKRRDLLKIAAQIHQEFVKGEVYA